MALEKFVAPEADVAELFRPPVPVLAENSQAFAHRIGIALVELVEDRRAGDPAERLALPLLAQAALLAFVRPGRPAGFRGGWRTIWTLLGLLPLLLYLLLLFGAWAVRLSAWKAGYQESWTGAALVVAALALWTVSPTPPAPAAAAAPPDRPAS